MTTLSPKGLHRLAKFLCNGLFNPLIVYFINAGSLSVRSPSILNVLFRCGLKAGDVILAINDKVNRDLNGTTVKYMVYNMMHG